MKDQIGVNRRIRWDKPLDWLAELENIRITKRRTHFRHP